MREIDNAFYLFYQGKILLNSFYADHADIITTQSSHNANTRMYFLQSIIDFQAIFNTHFIKNFRIDNNNTNNEKSILVLHWLRVEL